MDVVSQLEPRRRPRLRTAPVVLGVVAAFLLAACGVRAETPPPDAPVPGPVEVVRQDAAVTSADLARDTGIAAEAELDESVFAVLERIRLDSEEHVEALGGVYSVEEGGVVDTDTIEPEDEADDAADDEDTGEDADDDGEDADDEPPLDPVDPHDLVVRLAEAAAAARGAADQLDDAPLAQLLAVVGTSRLLQADALARSLETDRPEIGGAGLPTQLPVGLRAADLASIVVAEDQAGFALEIVAARSPEGGIRSRALATAARHRDTSDAWARLAGIAEPGLDPRSVSYALGGAADTPESRKELGASLENALATSYAALVALAEPGSRSELTELHTLAVESARRWGSPPGPFPGLG